MAFLGSNPSDHHIGDVTLHCLHDSLWLTSDNGLGVPPPPFFRKIFILKGLAGIASANS